jgi:acylphosphatase
MSAVVRKITYEGRVQGVGFRYTVKRLASGFEVNGTIRNLPDGRVEMQVAGEPAEVEEFLQAIRESGLAANIRLEIPEALPESVTFRGFVIL